MWQPAHGRVNLFTLDFQRDTIHAVGFCTTVTSFFPLIAFLAFILSSYLYMLLPIKPVPPTVLPLHSDTLIFHTT